MFDITKDEVLEAIIGNAMNDPKGVITYGDLAKILGYPNEANHYKFRDLLGEITEECLRDFKPVISSLVVNKNTMLCGQGFFNKVEQVIGFKPTAEQVRTMQRVAVMWIRN